VRTHGRHTGGSTLAIPCGQLSALARALRVSSADLLGDAPEYREVSPLPLPESGKDQLRGLLARLAEPALHSWVDADAHRGLTARLQELREKEQKPSASAAPLHLMIAIEHHGQDADRYTVSSWRQDDPTVWPPPRSETRVAQFDDLEAVVDGLVLDAEVAWAECSNEVRLEFCLPRTLLNLPVDQWRKELRSGDPRPLILDYPIVVRSLERMTTRHWHRVWRARWEALKENPAAVFPSHRRNQPMSHAGSTPA
jgi:hypothetical protein